MMMCQRLEERTGDSDYRNDHQKMGTLGLPLENDSDHGQTVTRDNRAQTGVIKCFLV